MSLDDYHIDTSTPTTFILIVRLIGCVSLFTNSIGIYVILSCSSRALGRYKYYQLAIQALAGLADISSSLLMTQVQFCPLAGGYFVGVLWSVFIIKSHHLRCAMEFLMGCQASALVSGFAFKHQMVLDDKKWYKMSATKFLVVPMFLYVIGAVINTTLLVFAELTPAQQMWLINTKYPQMRNVLLLENFYVMDGDVNPFWTYYSTYLGLLILVIVPVFVALSFHVFSILNSRQLKMSKKTLKIQRSSMKSLILQTLIPLLLYILPGIMNVIIYKFEITNVQDCVFTLFILQSCHSIGITVVMIAATNTYRKAVYLKMRTICRMPTVNNQTGISTVI